MTNKKTRKTKTLIQFNLAGQLIRTFESALEVTKLVPKTSIGGLSIAARTNGKAIHAGFKWAYAAKYDFNNVEVADAAKPVTQPKVEVKGIAAIEPVKEIKPSGLDSILRLEPFVGKRPNKSPKELPIVQFADSGEPIRIWDSAEAVVEAHPEWKVVTLTKTFSDVKRGLPGSAYGFRWRKLSDVQK